MKTKLVSVLFLVYALLAFPLFYFVYKFGDPTIVAHDFFSYYHLYNNWNWSNVNAPFNMRLISSFCVFLFNKAGFYYDTATAFDKYIGYGLDKAVYFNAILFNFLCVAATSTVIFFTVNKHVKHAALAFIAGLIYLLGFGTLFFELMPGTDAFSILLFALLFYAYLLEDNWVIILLLAAIFQREYILMAMALITVVDFLKTHKRYYLIICAVSVASFLCFFFLRRTLFYTPALSFQTSPGMLLHSLTHVGFPIVPFLKQTLITLNLYLIYLAVIIYKLKKGLVVNRDAFLKTLLLLAQLVLVSFAAVLGNNTGRYFYILIPFVIFEMARECQFLFKDREELLS